MTISSDGTRKESVLVQLGTPLAEANAAAVASTMQVLIAIVEEAKKEIKSNEALLIKARPFSEGSFEIPLDLILVGTALAFDGHPLIEHILQVLKEYVSLKKLLQGKPIPSDPTSAKESVAILGNISVTESVINILHNSHVTTLMDKAAADVQADATISNITISRGAERVPFVTIEREELASFRINPQLLAMDGERRDRPRRAIVIIHSPVLAGKAKWRFILEGHTFPASIQDEEFMERVTAGREAFAAGDRLDVDLSIHEAYDATLATYQPKSYTITHVHSHHKRPEQLLLP